MTLGGGDRFLKSKFLCAASYTINEEQKKSESGECFFGRKRWMLSLFFSMISFTGTKRSSFSLGKRLRACAILENVACKLFGLERLYFLLTHLQNDKQGSSQHCLNGNGRERTIFLPMLQYLDHLIGQIGRSAGAAGNGDTAASL